MIHFTQCDLITKIWVAESRVKPIYVEVKPNLTLLTTQNVHFKQSLNPAEIGH